jgi:hypothetical protein
LAIAVLGVLHININVRVLALTLAAEELQTAARSLRSPCAPMQTRPEHRSPQAKREAL